MAVNDNIPENTAAHGANRFHSISRIALAWQRRINGNANMVSARGRIIWHLLDLSIMGLAAITSGKQLHG